MKESTWAHSTVAQSVDCLAETSGDLTAHLKATLTVVPKAHLKDTYSVHSMVRQRADSKDAHWVVELEHQSVALKVVASAVQWAL